MRIGASQIDINPQRRRSYPVSRLESLAKGATALAIEQHLLAAGSPG